jgi:rubredoxin
MSVEQAVTTQQLEVSSSSVGVFTLPCGWYNPETKELLTEVQVREITGNEEDMLASTQIPAYKKVTTLLAGCLVRLGNVMDKGKLVTMVDELPQGDRMFLLFAIRRTTLGDQMPLREECPSCGEKSLFMLDLSELKTREMPDPTKRVYDVALPSGVSARFRVSTGNDEIRVAKTIKREREDALSQALLQRLELLNGEPPSLLTVKNLSLRDRLALRERFQEVEGGVDTAMDMECPVCGHTWEEEMDLSNRNFFFPSEKRNR